MSGLEFSVPSRLEDIFSASTSTYTIQELVSKRTITVEVLKFKRSVYEDYESFIFKNFDCYCSMLRQFEEFDEDLKMAAFKPLIQVSEKLLNSLPLILDDDTEVIDEQTQFQYRNLIKMLVYLLCEFAHCIETDIFKAALAAGAFKAKKGKKKTAESQSNLLWPEQRLKFLVSVKRIFQMPIKKFWNPPTLDHELVNFATTSFFKLLENTDVAKDKSIKPQIFSFLGSSLVEYKTGLAYCVKIIQLVQDYEHLPNVMAQAVSYFVIDCSYDTLIADLFREVTMIDVKILTQNLTVAHSLSQFLVSVSDQCPEKALAAISSLLQFLELESHVMRNCVLTILGNLICTLLVRDDLTKKEKQTRDEMLEYIEDHVLDGNSFVRCKSIQILKQLMENKALTTEQYIHIGVIISRRVNDKASNVRKNAISFLSLFIEINKFACQIPIEVLRESVQKENENLLSKWPNAYVLDDSDSETEPAQNGVFFDDSDSDVEMTPVDQTSASNKANSNVENSTITNITVSQNGTSDFNTQNTKSSVSSNSTRNSKASTVSNDITQNNGVTPNNASNGDAPTGETISSVNASTHETAPGASGDGIVDNAVNTGAPNTDPTVENSEDALMKQKLLVAYLKNTLHFAEVITNSVVPIRTLLMSVTQTDVLEAIDFFVGTHSIGLKESFSGVKDVFSLIWSKEPAVKEAAINAFRALYLVDIRNEKDAELVSKNLLLMMKNTTTEDLSNIQEFVKHLVHTEEISDSVINILWKNFFKPPPSLTEDESYLSLILFSMAADVHSELVFKNLAGLVHVGLGPAGENNFMIARETFNVLSKANKTKREKMKSFIESTADEFRLPYQSELGKRIKFFLLDCISNFDDDQWISMSDKAVETVISLIENPISVLAEISVELAKQINSQCMKASAVDPGDTTETVLTSSMLLARFMAFCGHVALHYLMYMEIDYFAYLRKRELQRDKRRRQSTAKNMDVTLTGTAKKKRYSIQSEYQLLPPMDEDATADLIDNLLAQNVKNEKKLVGILLPVVIETCKMTLKNHNKEIAVCAATALSKFMLLSDKVCEENMQLVATLMEKSSELAVRANLVISMGDLATKFPNIVEPWTPRIYERLQDPEPEVREAAIIILTHLILHDYIRVKGWISEVAKCIVDSNRNIADVASYLFEELSKKGNVIYNIIPDIISSLSDPSSGFSEENFQIVLKNVLRYVEKDKLVEGLVEKLCVRFTDTSTDLQIHELTFCLSLLKLTDKCFSKLMEFKNFIKERLSDPIVLKYITNLATNAKKNDSKTAAEIEAFRKELGI